MAAVTVSLTACSGVEGQRAQELLLQAQTAERGLRSQAFEGTMSYGLGGQNVQMEFSGAGSKTGQTFAIHSGGGVGRPFDMRVVLHGKTAWLRQNGGGWQRLPVPADVGGATRSASLGAAAFAELAGSVKAIRVSEHQVVGGEPSAIIGGELDAEGLLRSFARLSDFSDQLEGVDLGKLGVDLGEIKATLTVSERTHLLTSALVTTSMRVGEEKLDVRLTYRLTAANEAVRIPAVPGGTAS